MAIHNRVVVTGLGVLAANGIGLEAFWASLLDGRSGVGPLTLFDATGLPCRIAGEIKDFDPLHFMSPAQKPRRMGRFTQLALAAAKMAFEHANLPPAFLSGYPRLPIVMGVSTTAMDLREAPPRPYSAIAGIPHAAGSAIAYTHNIHARLVTLSDGCVSTLDAVAFAAQLIEKGETELAVAGGTDSTLARYVFDCMGQSRKLSLRNDDPARACRPFDRDRDGGVIAEGAGLVVVESLQHARARGATALAEITGFGSSADPPGSEEGQGMEEAMRIALANSCLRADDIDAVNAHGPGDPHMDRIETRLIRNVLGRRAYAIPVISIKGATGDPMGVGGVHQLISTVLMLQHDRVPPTTNLEHPEPECDLDYVLGAPRDARLQRVLINSHGFGRGNSSLVVERAP